MVLIASPGIVTEKLSDILVAMIFVFATVGEADVATHIPFSRTGNPPLFVIIPPDTALLWVMAVAFIVVITGNGPGGGESIFVHAIMLSAAKKQVCNILFLKLQGLMAWVHSAAGLLINIPDLS
jgi:hypothetical protein